MIRMFIQFLVLGAAVYYGYQNRYKLLNIVLSNQLLRKFLVAGTFSMPGVRGKMIQSVFTKPY
jgi:hypothetical protein